LGLSSSRACGLWTTTRRAPWIPGFAPTALSTDMHRAGVTRKSCRCSPPQRGVVRSRPQPLSTRAVLDPVDEVVDLLEHHSFLRHLAADLLAGVHDRGVIASAELLGDLRVAVVGELPEDVHADLTGRHQRTSP